MPNELWLTYAGTLGTSYDLPLVFDALRHLDNKNIRFMVLGDGPLMDHFKRISEELFVTFTGRLPYSQMYGVLKASDIVINSIVDSSVASIINKHADYAASGKPVISTQNSVEYRTLINRYDMGVYCSGKDAIEVSHQMGFLINNPKLRAKMGNGAHKCANEMFDTKLHIKRY